MTDTAARFSVRVTPRGGADRVDGVVEGILRVRVAAPPVGDAANEALTRLIARELGVPSSTVRIAGSRASRRKWLSVAGVDAAVVFARWPGLEVR